MMASLKEAFAHPGSPQLRAATPHCGL